jgi:Alcohol dehydrogenase GroES-like domain
MRAVRIHGKQDMRTEQVPSPEPDAGEVRLRMGYVGICRSDLHYYTDGAAGIFVIRQPLIPGHEVSGVIDLDPTGAPGQRRRSGSGPQQPTRAKPVAVFSGHRRPVGFAIDAGLVLSIAEPGRAGRAGEPQHRSRMRRFHGLQLEGRDVVPGPQ